MTAQDPTPRDSVLTDAECEAITDVLAYDWVEDHKPAFAFRPGWWTWEAPNAAVGSPHGPTLGWARRRLITEAGRG